MNDTWSPRQEERNSDRAKSILIIEDDTDIRDVLKEVFQEETIDMNGLELIDHVRRMRGYEQTPILLMSASLPWENISRHRIKYVRKPFDLDRLLELVEEALTTQDLEIEYTND